MECSTASWRSRKVPCPIHGNFCIPQHCDLIISMTLGMGSGLPSAKQSSTCVHLFGWVYIETRVDLAGLEMLAAEEPIECFPPCMPAPRKSVQGLFELHAVSWLFIALWRGYIHIAVESSIDIGILDVPGSDHVSVLLCNSKHGTASLRLAYRWVFVANLFLWLKAAVCD